MFLEITSRSFDIKFNEGDKLSQMRLVKKSNIYLIDVALKRIHKKNSLIFSNKKDFIDNGLKVSVDLSDDNKVCAYESKKTSSCIIFNKINYYKNSIFWKPLKPKDKTLIIEKNKFYILRSKEKIRIPAF